MILAGPVLGYLDPLMALPAVGAIARGKRRLHRFAAGALSRSRASTKAQAVFIVPVVALAAVERSAERRGVEHAMMTGAGAAFVSALALAPFVVAGAWRNVAAGRRVRCCGTTCCRPTRRTSGGSSRM